MEVVNLFLARMKKYGVRADKYRPVIATLVAHCEFDDPAQIHLERWDQIRPRLISMIQERAEVNIRSLKQFISVVMDLAGVDTESVGSLLEAAKCPEYALHYSRMHPHDERVLHLFRVFLPARGSPCMRTASEIRDMETDLLAFLDHCSITDTETLKKTDAESLRSAWQTFRGAWTWPHRRCLRVASYFAALHALSPIDIIGVQDKSQKCALPCGNAYLERTMAEFTAATSESRETVAALLAAVDKVDRSVLVALRQIQVKIPTLHEFCQMDHVDLKRLSSNTTGKYLYRFLYQQRCKPQFDPEGRFSSHLCEVTKETMMRWPLLWKCPAILARQVEQMIRDPEDVDHILRFVGTVADVRLDLYSHREEDRTFASVCSFICNVFLLSMDTFRQDIHWPVRTAVVHGIPWTYRELFPADITREELVHLVAAVTASRYRQLAKRPKNVVVRNAEPFDVMLRIMRFFNGAIRNGVFLNAGIRTNDVMNKTEIRKLLPQLERRNCELYRKQRPDFVVERKAQITESDRDALISAIQHTTAKWRAIILLLLHFAPRCNALHRLKLDAVWDAEKGCVRSRIVLIEKLSKKRVIAPNAQVQAALTQYITTEYKPEFRYLFSSPRKPLCIPKAVVRSAVKHVCKAAKVGPFNPHQFRSFIVHLFLKHGGPNGLDKASKYMGHEDCRVTYKHYYHIDLDHIGDNIPFLTSCAEPERPNDDNKSADSSLLSFEYKRRKQAEAQLLRMMTLLTPEQREVWEKMQLDEDAEGTNDASNVQSLDQSIIGDEDITDDNDEDPLARFPN